MICAMLAHTRVLTAFAWLAWIPYHYEDNGVDHHDNRAESVAQHVQENTPHVELGCRVVSILELFVRSAAVNLQIQAVTVTHLWAVEKKNWTVAQWSKVLFSDKSKFCFSFGNQGLEEDWRGTECKLLEVQCEVSEVRDDLGSRDVCWCWSIVFYQVQKVNAAIYQEILEHFMLPSADKLYGDADLLFQRDFNTCPQCQNHFQLVTDHDITVLDWPASMPDLKPIWNLWDIFKRKMRNSQSNNPDELKLNSASTEPQADRFHAKPH